MWARAHADPGDQAVAELRRSGLLGDGQRLEGREPGEDGVSREALRSARREALGEPRSLLDARGRLRSPGELGGQERVRHAARLALPGLQWFLQAGRCLEAVARGRAPNELRRAWLPFVPDLLSPGARDHLRSWCRGTPAMGRAASLLWAAGEAPPLARTRRSVLDGAILPSIVLPEVDFSAARIVRSDLSGATLTGASFSEARVERTALEGADLADATFVGARLRGVRLAGASLRGPASTAPTCWRRSCAGPT